MRWFHDGPFITEEHTEEFVGDLVKVTGSQHAAGRRSQGWNQLCDFGPASPLGASASPV